MRIFSKHTLITIARILGGIIFLFFSLIFFFYWNWPFSASGNRNCFPFAAITLYLFGYLVALNKGKWGGVLLILSAVMLSLTPILVSTVNETGIDILIVMIAVLLPLMTGILFILSSNTNTRNSQIK